MNDLLEFANEQFGEIRVAIIDGEPWFVGKDVATALGYSSAPDALKKHVDEDDKIVGRQNADQSAGVGRQNADQSNIVDLSITDSLGRTRYPIWINESGMYSLILSSKLPAAKEFKHWVTSEVLPSIRKTGSYNGEIPTEKIKLGNYIKVAEILSIYRTPESLGLIKNLLGNAGFDFEDHTVEKLPVGIAIETEPTKIENPLRPSVPVEIAKDAIDFMEGREPDGFSDGFRLYNISSIAKAYGYTIDKGPNSGGAIFNKRLENVGVIYRDDMGKWCLSECYARKGIAKEYTSPRFYNSTLKYGTYGVKLIYTIMRDIYNELPLEIKTVATA